ncbi:hypothetical protein EVAR_13502_1 [Eumeta japonica]|uniref:Uncharacterized protein n=1 Tax=Eumeta variegata TaxID=151549 RepID=A0A4C1UZJ7_EUMVA|nr:hypothetical protein EVAR_13502_1 [Eumeta japonica]
MRLAAFLLFSEAINPHNRPVSVAPPGGRARPLIKINSCVAVDTKPRFTPRHVNSSVCRAAAGYATPR